MRFFNFTNFPYRYRQGAIFTGKWEKVRDGIIGCTYTPANEVASIWSVRTGRQYSVALMFELLVKILNKLMN